jgi:protocatechuate 3,4-dioxygenase beta subunit
MTDNSAEEATNFQNEAIRTAQQHGENEFESIKTLIAPFREILSMTLDECVLKRIYHITLTVGSTESPFPGLAIYKLHTLCADGGF